MGNEPNKQQGQQGGHSQSDQRGQQSNQQGQNPTGSVDTSDKRKPGQSQSDGERFKDVSKKDPSRQPGGHQQEQEDEKRRAS